MALTAMYAIPFSDLHTMAVAMCWLLHATVLARLCAVSTFRVYPIALALCLAASIT